jgi:cell division protein FtsB
MNDWLKNINKKPKLTKLMIVILIGYVVWMVFFDENSLLTHRELNKELNKIETENNYYKNKTKQDQQTIKKLKNIDSLEKFAREKYLMKKGNEEIFIVDSITIK